MSASRSTVMRIGTILVEELGIDDAIRLVRRICREVEGNASYTETMKGLLEELQTLYKASKGR